MLVFSTTDTTWNAKYPDTKVQRHSFSCLAGKLIGIHELKMNIRHRYGWGKLDEKDCCTFEPDPRIETLATYLSQMFKKEMGNFIFNGGQLLKYADEILASIPWHQDGTPHRGGVEGNSQVGGTGVISATLEGEGGMLFGARCCHYNTGEGVVDEVACVNFKKGHVFFMSALADRLLKHKTKTGACGRLALILRCLNQPRIFQEGDNGAIIL